METIVLLAAFLISIIIGFLVIKKVDAFLEESREQKDEDSGGQSGGI